MQVTNYPKFSIITPSYNQGRYLEKTILSIINQNYPNVEHIIIDGGSTDNSVEILKKYEDQITWVSEKDNGTYDANNKGLRLITGDYWCVVNSDDILLPGALNVVSQVILDHPAEQWICGGEYHIDENDKVTAKHMPQRPLKLIEGFTFLDGCWISHPTVFLHKDIVKNIGEFSKFHLMDLNYWLRLEKKGFSPYIINEYIAALRIHNDSKSSDSIKLTKECLKVINDFVIENGLETNGEIKYNLNSGKIFLLRLMFYKDLTRRNIKLSILLLFKIFSIRKSVIFQRWYWGGVRRLFSLSSNDPLLKQFSSIDSKANWDD